MSNSELNYLEEVLLMSKDPTISKEEFNEFLSQCPDSVKEAFAIITEDRLSRTLQLAN